MTSDIDVNPEPLPGYRLIEHIGAGGYGEVWRAEAPGGLTKAIKFVFGQQHEKRASNELRALERVRGVRHPFLLSLERIEIVNGRLLVVTELADGSLKERFDACRREGQPGIPRDELLGYLRDAADALDFMREAHALQHLDVKPENMLLLAGHVKVADFGLVKDFRQSQASMVGGMTPLYAAPEVFRGNPSAHSDQYSLAIVYHELLTGSLPFAGGNAAELTLQHLNDEPNLADLSVADRYVVSRALAKEPQHRYTSCRQFVDTLPKATTAENTEPGPPSEHLGTPFDESFESARAVPRNNPATELFDEDPSAFWNIAPAQMLVELPPADQCLVELPPIDMAQRKLRPTPALVLGIGGAAGRVLTHLRRILHERFGRAVDLPAIQLLLLDTDSTALSEVTHHDGTGLAPEETLSLALRRPQHYREQSQQLLHWLSRRWLYNIPRSLRTEGLRPLGRLALTDHARQIGQRIRRAVAQAVDAAAIVTSEQSCGQAFDRDRLRVFIVSSISGGTGGGASLDIGYLVRTVLQKLNLSPATITGLMLHTTGCDPRHAELARVNAFAWLAELQHFANPENQYPGDPSCGLPPHPRGVPPFDHTYLVQLGEGIDSDELDCAVQSVAEYLQLDVLSPAGAFFDACRTPPLGDPSDARWHAGGTLRSFGICHRTAAPTEACEQFASLVSQQVLTAWRPAQQTAEPREIATAIQDSCERQANATALGEVAAGAAQLTRRLQLDSAGIAANARALVELQLGGDASAFLASWFAKQSSTREASEAVQLQAIDRIFGAGERDAAEGRKVFLLGQPVASIIQPLDEKLRSEIRRWVSGRVDNCRERLHGARRAVAWLTQHCTEAEAELQRLRRTIVEKLTEIRQAAIVAGSSAPTVKAPQVQTSISQHQLDYFRLRLDQLAIAGAEHTVHLILSDAKTMSDELTALGREIEQIVAAVSRSATASHSHLAVDAGQACTPSRNARLTALVQPKLSELVTAVDAQLQAEFINPHGGLLKMVMHGGRTRALLSAKLHALSRQAVQHLLAGVNVLEEGAGADESQLGPALRSSLAIATPSALQFGGSRRVLAILPRDSAQGADVTAFSRAIGTDVTAIAGCDNSLTLCVEADRLSLRHVALELVQRRRDRVQFAERVHCRIDIDWMPLVSLSTAPSAPTPADWTAAPCAGPRQTQSRQDQYKTLVM